MALVLRPFRWRNILADLRGISLATTRAGAGYFVRITLVGVTCDLGQLLGTDALDRILPVRILGILPNSSMAPT
jgi:hypothetical protein